MRTAFSEWLRERRKSKFLSLSEVSAKLGVSVSTISDWELGEHLPRADHLLGLSALYGMTGGELQVWAFYFYPGISEIPHKTLNPRGEKAATPLGPKKGGQWSKERRKRHESKKSQTSSQSPEMITDFECARMAGVSRATWWKWTKSVPNLPSPYRIGERSTRWKRTEVEEYLRSTRVRQDEGEAR